MLTILPGTLPADELERRLADTDAAVVLKLGRSYPAVREALSSTGRLDEAFYVERASTPRQRVLPAGDVDDDSRAVLLAGDAAGQRHDDGPTTGSVAVVGLGPGDTDWMTPQSRRELAAATDLIGYGPYLDRVGTRDGQRRHPSDNTDEPARARLACTLAEQGRAVAVVSSGDPGVFAMATAVLEEAKQWPGVRVRVIPAMTAAQAVASRVGAPLGHDYAVISLSDRLKPWDVIAARLTAAATADLVLAIYNPASKTRTWQVGAMRDLLLEHRDPGTPVVIGRDVSGPTKTVKVVRLADLDPAEVDMRCLLIVGSSQTQWYRRPATGLHPAPLPDDPDADLTSRWRPCPIADPTDVTPQWLGAVLGAESRRRRRHRSAPGRPAPPTGCRRPTPPSEPTCRATFAIKLSAQDDAVRERVALGYRSEARLLHRRRRRGPGADPQHFHCEISADGGDFVLLLADMAPAVQGDQIAGCTPAGGAGSRWGRLRACTAPAGVIRSGPTSPVSRCRCRDDDAAKGLGDIAGWPPTSRSTARVRGSAPRTARP